MGDDLFNDIVTLLFVGSVIFWCIGFLTASLFYLFRRVL